MNGKLVLSSGEKSYSRAFLPFKICKLKYLLIFQQVADCSVRKFPRSDTSS